MWAGLKLIFKKKFNARLDKFTVHTVHNYKVGKNLPVNRLAKLKNKMELKLLNLTRDTYKVHCKILLLEGTG